VNVSEWVVAPIRRSLTGLARLAPRSAVVSDLGIVRTKLADQANLHGPDLGVRGVQGLPEDLFSNGEVPPLLGSEIGSDLGLDAGASEVQRRPGEVEPDIVFPLG
jgi:hypothetical protein